MSEQDSMIYCSNCKTPLCEVWPRDESKKIETRIKALCCHCGDSSFVKTFNGTIFVGATEYTGIDSMETTETEYSGREITKQNLNIHTIKVKDYVK